MLVILSQEGKLNASWAQADELLKLGALHIKQVRTFFSFIFLKNGFSVAWPSNF